jgi:prepilin-type N-terminal cleavage/methylation domain-containing protein
MKKTERQSDRAGFTLIEMLIVVTIVGLLSMMAIGSYTHYRKSSLVGLAADNIVSSLYKARDEVKLGKQSGDDKVYCKGLKFVAGDNGGVMEIRSEFNAQKSWGGDDGWSKGSCGQIEEVGDIALDDLVEVKEVGDLDMGECVFFYSPPNGEVSGVGVTCGNVLLKYGDSGEDQFERKLQFNGNTGIVNITNLNTKDEEVVDDEI